MLALVAAACRDAPTDPNPSLGDAASTSRSHAAARVSICHRAGGKPLELAVGVAALPDHLAHGDYVTTLMVSRSTTETGDGIRFRRIGDALAQARAARLAHGELEAASCPITILVAAGTYPGSTVPTTDEEEFPLVVDVPDLRFRGALAVDIDATGRAVGPNAGASETILAPTVPLPVIGGVSTPVFLANGRPGSSAGHRLVIEGFVFRSGHTGIGTDAGGQGVLSVRVRDILVRRNRFEPGFTESIDLRASSGEVLQNLLGGTAGTCDVCLAGPGRYAARGNRLAAGGVPGITVSGVVGLPVPAGIDPFVLPASAETWAEVRNNEVRDHLRTPVGVGLRVETVGVMAPNVHNTIHAVLQDNLLVNNRFGIIIHAGFPVAGTLLRSDAHVTLGGNTIEQSCQTKLLVALSRHQRTLGLNAVLPYLLSSTFQLDLKGNLSWDEVWFGHPAGFGNALIVDGEPVANGIRQFYDPAGCPGL